VVAEENKMKLSYFVFFMMISVFLVSLTGCTGSYQVEDGKYDAFAQCLTEKEVVMYGTDWCSHCQNQKAMFGSSFEYVDFVDCEISNLVCSNAGIKGYPTWNIEGNNYPGEQSFNRLSELSGCKLV